MAAGFGMVVGSVDHLNGLLQVNNGIRSVP